MEKKHTVTFNITILKERKKITFLKFYVHYKNEQTKTRTVDIHMHIYAKSAIMSHAEESTFLSMITSALLSTVWRKNENVIREKMPSTNKNKSVKH